MIEIPQYLKTIDLWCFSIYIAPRDLMKDALPEVVNKFRSVTCLYNNPGMRIFKPESQLYIRSIQIENYDELYSAILEIKSSLLLIEYSDEWFYDNFEKIQEFGSICQDYTRKYGTVAIISSRMNYVIRSLELFNPVLKWVKTDPMDFSGQQKSYGSKHTPVKEYEQQLLY
jgi:hypothetical protein